MTITHISGAAWRRSQRTGGAAQTPVRGTSALWADAADAVMKPLPTIFPPGDPTAAEQESHPRPELPDPQEGVGLVSGGRVRALPVAVPLRRRPTQPLRRETWNHGGAALGQSVSGHLATEDGGAPESGRRLWQDARPWSAQDYSALRHLKRGLRRRAGGTVTTQAELGGAARQTLGRPGALRSAGQILGSRVRAKGIRLTGGWLLGLIISVLVVTGAVALSVGGFLAAANPIAEPLSSGADASITVESGQTLWQIASGYTGTGEDVRDTALRIAQVNGLQDGAVRAGQVLSIPADVARG